MPGNGRIFAPVDDAALNDVLQRGCWSEKEFTHQEWQVNKLRADGSCFDVLFQGEVVGQVDWNLVGDHNVNNALMAIAAARHVGVVPELACEALGKFINTKRRLELKGEVNGITVYDDFAHHPTAIELTLDGLRNKVGQHRILAVVEPRSSTMKMGVHKDTLANSLKIADQVYLYQPDTIDWSVEEVAEQCSQPCLASDSVQELVNALVENSQPNDHILIMSNGGFEGIHTKLLQALEA